jgi:cyclophilin family peptidyl-prolyl cis-trans isomerase
MPSQAKRQRKKEGARARAEALRLAQQRAARRRRVILIGGAVVAILLVAYLTSRSNSSSGFSAVAATSKASTTKCPADDGSAPATKTWKTPPPACINVKKHYTATFDTSEGKVVVTLDTKRTPKTTNNFVVLSRYHFYDGTPIFRTDTSIDIIQGGGQSASDAGPGYTIPDEGGKFSYAAGDLVMARTQQPNSAGAQFFFVTGPKAAALNGQGTYVTFGKVKSGLDVVRKIIGLNQDQPGGLGGAPSKPVTVKTITIAES